MVISMANTIINNYKSFINNSRGIGVAHGIGELSTHVGFIFQMLMLICA